MGEPEDRSPEEVTDQIRRHWDRQARGYDASMSRIERFLFGDGRAWACAQAVGETLDVGVGTGLNLPLYPSGVRITGIDLSPAMLAVARDRGAELGIDADLRVADAERLPFADDAFDTVVCTLTLCSVPDVDLALREMRRVLRPGGRLVLLDHVRPTSAPLRWLLLAIQWGMNRIEPGNGEQMMRRPFVNARELGFEVDERHRAKGGAVERVSARRPG
ncbi:class I SAM-dependent methyltransferase [Nocardiopsis sediminis]|uniref:Class I SAM-dependent methyltransferase n=1 Tax=Nocardiopsis sediminis TaxID=1778267 RepID=A0ABV8FHN7_9ACTN